jgi:hypothetical protein
MKIRKRRLFAIWGQIMRAIPGISLSVVAAALFAAPLPAQPGESRPWNVAGRIDDGDRKDTDERRYDEHRLRLEAGRRYRISAGSEDFDTIIRLFRPGQNEPVAENDDFNPEVNLDSRLNYSPAETGDYVLRVLTYGPEGKGAYAARAELQPPLPPPVSAPASSRAATQWQIWDGQLAASDPDRDGNHFDDYLIQMRAGETRLISLESESMDVMIWVLRAAQREGEPIEQADDTGSTTNALLGFRAEEEGDYLIRVTAFSSGATGTYRLRISDALTPPAVAPAEPEPVPEVDAAAPEAEPTPPPPAPDHPPAR